MTSIKLDPKKVEEVADKAIGYLSGAGISGLVYLGDRLGLYRALSESGPSTSAQLAAKTGLHERWVREWPHGQASAGLVRSPSWTVWPAAPAKKEALAWEPSGCRSQSLDK